MSWLVTIIFLYRPKNNVLIIDGVELVEFYCLVSL